ncbi:hypothetical protein M9H77_17849 [Catharanthus roseus]|uniref:Uncharacterized protein n=1 Tax=Catharanthus roseus TaxID=4058 RepID=A0ACC0B5S2_CATRO|nr:hypothetical protein M9H77_17849 [Catharanthus roseus]
MEKTIVLYPAPGIGHMISMLELAKLILHHHSHKFSAVHILITTGFRDIKSSYLDRISIINPSIIFHHLPFVQPDFTLNRSVIASAFDFIRLNASNVGNSLQEISRTSRICAFVIDLFCTSAMPCAEELGIPTYYFFTSGLASLAAYLYFPTIHQQINQSFKELPHIEILIPGLPPIPATHVPEPVLNRDDPAYRDILYFSEHLPKSNGILVNTFDELEPIPMKAITDGLNVPVGTTPPIYNIGPLMAEAGSRPAECGNDKEDTDLHQNECLSWLDKHPNGSIVFLCFGSRGSFTVEQIKEIANGLERSGHRFLWVVKKPLDYDIMDKQVHQLTDFELDNTLPEGFLERTKGKGLVAKSWAPQLQVLKHSAVGGFVSHCGWNSSLEAIVAGIPMVAWPLYAEQHINRAVLVHDIKLAVDLEHDDNGIVIAEEIERKLKELMDVERGREVKEQSAKMRDLALAALGNSGSSAAALAKLVQFWSHS